MKWKYTLRHRSEFIYEVLENGRRLLSVFHPQDQDGYHQAWDDPFIVCDVRIKPFVLRFRLFSDATPVFVYQERRLPKKT
jgi:hypothetical protein